MEVRRVTADWYLNNGGTEMSVRHLKEAMPVTATEDITPINYDIYKEMEANECLVILAALENDQMLGYVIAVAQPSIHNEGKWEATTTSFYTLPEVRQLGIARELFTHLVALCKETGIVDLNYVVSESVPEVHQMVQKLGMIKAETTYSLRISE